MDESGQVLEDAGTGEEGEHLFMYQIGPDGPPTLSSTAMSWSGGAQPWLHPEQGYTLRVDMSEPNGASDLTTVEIQLASNILTSPLSFTWDFRTDYCTSHSIHLINSRKLLPVPSSLLRHFLPCTAVLLTKDMRVK